AELATNLACRPDAGQGFEKEWASRHDGCDRYSSGSSASPPTPDRGADPATARRRLWLAVPADPEVRVRREPDVSVPPLAACRGARGAGQLLLRRPRPGPVGREGAGTAGAPRQQGHQGPHP